MKLPASWRAAWAAVLFAQAAVLAVPVRDHLRAAGLLLRVGGDRGRLALAFDEPIVREDLTIPSAAGPVRARIYRPRAGGRRRGLVLAHGVHYRGIDERRLVPFAENLARAGVVVLTPELRALADYRVQASSVEELRASVAYLDASPYAAPGGVGMLGLSFAGLCLRAAADPSVRDRVAYVVSFGGHGDLRRVSHFLATDELVTVDGPRTMRAHDYGLVVLLYAYAERFVPAGEVEGFRDALRWMLHEDRPQALRAGQALTGTSRVLFDQVLAHDRASLGPRIAREFDALRADMDAASPAPVLGAVRAPVYLLHGSHDDVIPPTEVAWVERGLRGARVPVHPLVTDAISHVSVQGRPTASQQWAIVRFMAGVLGE